MRKKQGGDDFPGGVDPAREAVRVVHARAAAGRCSPLDGIDPGDLLRVGRLTVNFHPDRIAASGRSVVQGFVADGEYRSQWVTSISNGGRSATVGGHRHRWETELFGGAYAEADPREVPHPVYGALDLLHDPFGGSPRFGSCCLVLANHVAARTTFCVGDSHVGPEDVGTEADMTAIAVGLVEQARRRDLLGQALGLDNLARVVAGQRVGDGPARELDSYVEAQVHGGISFGEDVDAIIADPSYRGTEIETHLTSLVREHGCALSWHVGSVLSVDEIPTDFRGPEMAPLAAEVAIDGRVDARAIGLAARDLAVVAPSPEGDPEDSRAQLLKRLWHTVLAFGSAA